MAGSGTQSDPYDGSTATKFDTAMNGVGPNTCIHLGPGTFETAGYYDGITGTYWQAKTGMRIAGSGIDVTTLKLVNTTPTTQRVYVIGHALSSSTVDFFEVSNLTFDCNLGALSGTSSTAGAVRLMGNHSRVVRVKVINWGNKNSGTPGFVIAMLTGDPSSGVIGVVNCGIEECIAITPHSSAAGPVTVLHCGGKETASTARKPSEWVRISEIVLSIAVRRPTSQRIFAPCQWPSAKAAWWKATNCTTPSTGGLIKRPRALVTWW